MSAMKNLAKLLALLIILAPVAMTQTWDTGERGLIKDIEIDWENAWNRHDVKALTTLVDEDVDFITETGVWLKGRKLFEEHIAYAHTRQYKESAWTTTQIEVNVLRDDIAIVHVSWLIKGEINPDGTPRQIRQGLSTRLMIKQKGRWLIAASQNTKVE